MKIKEYYYKFSKFISTLPRLKLWLFLAGIAVILAVVGINTFGAIRGKQKQTNLDKKSLNSITADSTTVNSAVGPSDTTESQRSGGTTAVNNGSTGSSAGSGTGSSAGSNSGNSSSSSSAASLSSCGSSNSFFDHAPTMMNEFSNIAPLGNLNPTGHVFPTDHIYFYHSKNSTSTIYAPGKVTVTRISASENQTAGITDFSIYFKPCNELEVYYLHISTISQKLVDAFAAPFSWDSTYTTGGSTYRNYGRNVNISLESGEAIGTFTGQYAFDMGAYDSRVTLNFINPNARPNSTHTVCPLDYYSSDLKAALYSYLGSSASTKRTVAPLCGTIDQDIADTAQGVWLLSGTTKVNGEDQHLALVHQNTDPTVAAFSVGNSIGASGLSSGVYTFTPSGGSYNKDFNTVTVDSGPQCYRATSRSTSTILIQLTSPTTLKIEKLSGDCDSQRSFTGNETLFQR